MEGGGLSAAGFSKVNEAAGSQRRALETRSEELRGWLAEHRTRVATAERLLGAIASYLSNFECLDFRRQKAQLQVILKSAYVCWYEHIEQEFQG